MRRCCPLLHSEQKRKFFKFSSKYHFCQRGAVIGKTKSCKVWNSSRKRRHLWRTSIVSQASSHWNSTVRWKELKLRLSGKRVQEFLVDGNTSDEYFATDSVTVSRYPIVFQPQKKNRKVNFIKRFVTYLKLKIDLRNRV